MRCVQVAVATAFVVSALPRLLSKTTKTLALQCSKEALWRKWARLPYPTTWFRPADECMISKALSSSLHRCYSVNAVHSVPVKFSASLPA